MADRPTIRLPWGEGLERRKGVMSIEPAKMTDLRNVFLDDGKAVARKGLEVKSTLVDETTTDLETVLALSPLRSEAAALGLGYADGNKRVHANRLTIDGDSPSHVASSEANGEVWTIPGAATFDPPIVQLADTHNRVFMAHDEPNISARQATRYYDPFASPAIQTLQADLDGAGDADTKFRGVVRWLSYLVGWGYNKASEPDRPDYVRVSLSGDPLIWKPKHFFLAGQRSEPVLTCQPAGQADTAVLLVFKETEIHRIFGYSPQTFGIKPADTLFGLAGSRLAVAVGGTVFFWSHEGPRMSNGGASVDLAPPLDIGGPDPAGLVAESNPEVAFAQYFPQDRVVCFVWGRRVYALSIRDPARPRWSYWELGASAQPRCGALFFSTLATGGGGTAPTGWPVIQDGSTVLNDASIEITVFNNGGGGANGTEAIEPWLKDVDGPNIWVKQGDVLIDLSGGGPNFSQTLTLSGLDPLHEYEVSLRYRAAGAFTTGFTDADPALWNDPTCPACPDDPPAYRAALFTTATAPTLTTRSGDNGGLWERTGAAAEQITIDIVIPAGHENLVMKLERQRETNGDTGVQNINGMGPPDSADQVVEAFTTIEAALAAGTTQYVDTAITSTQIHTYRVTFLSPGASPDSAVSSSLECWAGPDPPSNLGLVDAGSGNIDVSWVNSVTPSAARACPPQPPSAHDTGVWWTNITQGPPWNLETVTGPFSTAETVTATGAINNDEIGVGIRHLVTCSGIVGYSRWALPGFDSVVVSI